ncbi:MAG: hypothetical protein R2856_37625 [Caldilineaceae bacterium]
MQEGDSARQRQADFRATAKRAETSEGGKVIVYEQDGAEADRGRRRPRGGGAFA